MTETAAPPQGPPTPRSLYRDPDNSMFAGVCTAVGRYTGTDPVIWRIVTINLPALKQASEAQSASKEMNKELARRRVIDKRLAEVTVGVDRFGQQIKAIAEDLASSGARLSSRAAARITETEARAPNLTTTDKLPIPDALCAPSSF